MPAPIIRKMRTPKYEAKELMMMLYNSNRKTPVHSIDEMKTQDYNGFIEIKRTSTKIVYMILENNDRHMKALINGENIETQIRENGKQWNRVRNEIAAL